MRKVKNAWQIDNRISREYVISTTGRERTSEYPASRMKKLTWKKIGDNEEYIVHIGTVWILRNCTSINEVNDSSFNKG
jgi:hypothetical protein